MLRSEPSLRSRESVALQPQVPPKRKNEHADGCISGLSLRLPAASDDAGMDAAGMAVAQRHGGRNSLGVTGRASRFMARMSVRENPQTLRCAVQEIWCWYYCRPPAPADAARSSENVVSLRNRMGRIVTELYVEYMTYANWFAVLTIWSITNE
jgi:hypothetical protein